MKKTLLVAATASLAFAVTAAAQQPSPSLAPPPDAPPVHAIERGPYAVTIEANPGLMTHTIYRPAHLEAFEDVERLPIVAWGNGACSNAGLLFSNFLSQIASHGYLVIASGPKDAPLPGFSSGGDGAIEPDPNSGIAAGRTVDEDLLKAVDWAIAETLNPDSPYYDTIDPTKVAVMGQSCGGLQATAVAPDPRVTTAVIWNSGVFNAGGDEGRASAGMSGATKATLAEFHAPTAYFPGGPSDVAYANSVDDYERLAAMDDAPPVFFGSINVGHGGTFRHPGAGWAGEVGVAWLDWHLKGDSEAGRMFSGPECGLCANEIWEVRQRGM